MGRGFVQSGMNLVAQTECEQRDGSASIFTGQGNRFRSAGWSPDGTCLITNSTNNKIETFIVPPQLLDQHESPLQLKSYSAIESWEPADAITCFPAYALEDVSTTLVLSAVNEHPIRLNSALTGGLVASYPLVNPNTEAYIKPQSMTFNTDGGHFVAGSQNLISIFDVSRPGNEPLTSIKTGPKKGNGSWSNPTLSLRGLISSLSVDGQYNVLAAGTLSRHIGLYDSAGEGECIGVFSIAGTDADKAIAGHGITQLAWSGCGRYLYIAERKSDGAMIYDIRQSGQLLSWICGRAAMTNQRMNFNLTSHMNGSVQDIWAGSQDGKVRRWSDAHLHQGPVEPVETFHVHSDTVHSVSVHPSASVIATASGQREADENVITGADLKSTQESEYSSLKLWHRTNNTAED